MHLGAWKRLLNDPKLTLFVVCTFYLWPLCPFVFYDCPSRISIDFLEIVIESKNLFNGDISGAVLDTVSLCCFFRETLTCSLKWLIFLAKT